MKTNYIEVGDCLDLMRKMEDKSVDYVFTSPPYNKGGNDIGRLGKGNIHQKYETVETYDNYFDWLCERVDEMIRVSRKCVLINLQGTKNVRKDLYKFIGKYAEKIHDIVIWHKPNACPTSTPHKISNAYEMLILIKPEGVEGVDVTSETYFQNVITLPSNMDRRYTKVHRAVMSTEFCSEMIKEFTTPGSIVLDPFMGMGTTGVCCALLGREYIGFEISEKYTQLANERIKEETAKKSLW